MKLTKPGYKIVIERTGYVEVGSCEKCGMSAKKRFLHKLWLDGKFVFYCSDCKKALLKSEKNSRMI